MLNQNLTNLKYFIIQTLFIILFLIIVFPYIRVYIHKWKLNVKKQRELKIEREKELEKRKRDIESVRLAKIRAIAKKENEEKLKIAKDKQVTDNNAKYKISFSDKYKNARIYHEVQYTGAYRIPIAEYNNYDLNIYGISFFIDNLKSAEGKGKIEVRYQSFQDEEFDTYTLEIIDGFTILNQRLKSKDTSPRKDHSSTYRRVYLTIRESSFKKINTGIVHNIIFTPYSILDWK